MRTFRARPNADAADRAATLARRFGSELRVARVNGGLSQRQLALKAGVSQQAVSLAERGSVGIALDVRCRLVRGVGHELGWKLYPTGGVGLRDSGQLGVAKAIIVELHHALTARLEVPVAPGDLRAADLVIYGAAETIHIEIERGLFDLQAQVRAAQLKRDLLAQSSQVAVRLVLAVPDSPRARRTVDALPSVLAAAFPLPSPSVWRALRRGTPLGADGLLFVRSWRRSQTRR
jgi:transcriptional regulator with XRE-family HTH domain